jgi:hypothetical protein
MHNEEDTFNRLRKSTLDEVRSQASRSRVDVFMGRVPKEVVISILRSHGWTLEEYDQEIRNLVYYDTFGIKSLPNGDFKVLKGND